MDDIPPEIAAKRTHTAYDENGHCLMDVYNYWEKFIRYDRKVVINWIPEKSPFTIREIETRREDERRDTMLEQEAVWKQK